MGRASGSSGADARGRPPDYDLRWFTPATEVDLCGHASLAGAHVLCEEGHVGLGETIRFHTKSGPLTAGRVPAPLAGDGPWRWLDFPSEPPGPAEASPELLSALGLGYSWQNPDVCGVLTKDKVVSLRSSGLS